jgi:hypothetical protein
MSTSSTVVEDLFEETSVNGTRSAWTYVGEITFDFTGSAADPLNSVVFDPAGEVAVPEPTTYGLLAGASMLLMALRRQFMAKVA